MNDSDSQTDHNTPERSDGASEARSSPRELPTDQSGCVRRTRPFAARSVARSRRGVGTWFSTPFLVASALLGGAAILGGPVTTWLELVRHKDPLPLTRPLQAMDRDALGPFRVVKVEILRAAELEALATTDVISWWLEDKRLGEEAPRRRAHLLVTFYTGTPTLVPHTPELCWVAQGYQQVHGNQDTLLEVPNLPSELSPMPIRMLTFGKTSVFGGVEQSVLYTFFCNGQFTRSRNRVRSLTSNPFARHAFYSKVEVSFIGATGAETLDKASDLLSYVLPELLARHWPDFEKAERAAN